MRIYLLLLVIWETSIIWRGWVCKIVNIILVLKPTRFASLMCPLYDTVEGFPSWLSGKESACQCRKCVFYPRVGKIPWRKKWQPTPVFLPGKSHDQRSLVGCSPWGHKESDTIKDMHTWHCRQWLLFTIHTYYSFFPIFTWFFTFRSCVCVCVCVCNMMAFWKSNVNRRDNWGVSTMTNIFKCSEYHNITLTYSICSKLKVKINIHFHIIKL